MTSSVSWLDFSEEERRKMMGVVRFFQEQDTRDELGVALIRDKLSDILFPGTGTLQTRARYFFFVPWLLRQYEQRSVPSKRVAERLRLDEIKIIHTLIRIQAAGVIGQNSRENLNRFASSIYWYGLRRWGILNFSGSLGEYSRSLNSYYKVRKELRNLDQIESQVESPYTNWDPNLPAPPKKFPADIDFNLSREEAAYLKDKLQLNCGDSLLAYFVRVAKPIGEVAHAWQHPASRDLPHVLKNKVHHAQNFSEIIHGASLLYNYLLAEKAGMTERVDNYADRLDKWQKAIDDRKNSFTSWDMEGFWSLLDESKTVPFRLKQFVAQWHRTVLELDPSKPIFKSDSATRLVINREFRLKGARSRFENPRRLELWGGSSGAGQLDFRWGGSKRIINDIVAGLEREA